jgi:hypothetical protein
MGFAKSIGSQSKNLRPGASLAAAMGGDDVSRDSRAPTIR